MLDNTNTYASDTTILPVQSEGNNSSPATVLCGMVDTLKAQIHASKDDAALYEGVHQDLVDWTKSAIKDSTEAATRPWEQDLVPGVDETLKAYIFMERCIKHMRTHQASLLAGANTEFTNSRRGHVGEHLSSSPATPMDVLVTLTRSDVALTLNSPRKKWTYPDATQQLEKSLKACRKSDQKSGEATSEVPEIDPLNNPLFKMTFPPAPKEEGQDTEAG